MHVILLKFGPNKASAPQYMEAHNAWIAKGLADGVFHCVGSLEVGGGCLLAQGESSADIQTRVNADPFVQHNVVTAEIHQVDVKKTSPQLSHFQQTCA